jgi:hypothetical protein
MTPHLQTLQLVPVVIAIFELGQRVAGNAHLQPLKALGKIAIINTANMGHQPLALPAPAIELDGFISAAPLHLEPTELEEILHRLSV